MEHISLFKLIELGFGLGAFGLVAWLVMHVTRVTIPKIVESFERVNREQREDFRETLSADRERFFQEVKVERDRYNQMVDRALKRIDDAA